MQKPFGRFILYFCIVMAIYIALNLAIDLGEEGSGSWWTGLMVSGFLALVAMAYENQNR